MITVPIVAAAVVLGAASSAGGWLWGKVTHLKVHVSALEARVAALEPPKQK